MVEEFFSIPMTSTQKTFRFKPISNDFCIDDWINSAEPFEG